MKRILYLSVVLLIFGCQNFTAKQAEEDPDNKHIPRIAIAGLAIESSTFSPAVTHEEAFHAKTGEAVFSIYPENARGLWWFSHQE